MHLYPFSFYAVTFMHTNNSVSLLVFKKAETNRQKVWKLIFLLCIHQTNITTHYSKFYGFMNTQKATRRDENEIVKNYMPSNLVLIIFFCFRSFFLFMLHSQRTHLRCFCRKRHFMSLTAFHIIFET